MNVNGHSYRPEIDGLRGLAVLAVVLFHANVPWFHGGYVGVDVFFVISGYLITRIVRSEIELGSFSLGRFFERRVRRIFPALFTTLFVTTALAAWVQFPDEFANTGNSLVATSVFLANYHFMGDTGYFAAAAHSKPLLHMWSLAVEEQYYLFFPPLLLIVWQWGRQYAAGVLATLLISSFAYSALLTGESPDAAYYSTVSRAWQLMLGSMLAITGWSAYRQSHTGPLLGGLGLFAILTSILIYDQSTPFPGLAASLPTLGAASIIVGSGERGLAKRILCWAPLHRTGLISFSLYLWHWPIIYFAYAWSGVVPSGVNAFALIALALFVSWCSWRWIEQPVRHSKLNRTVLFIGAAVCVIGAVIIGLVIRSENGMPGRFSPESLEILSAQSDEPVLGDCLDLGRELKVCRLGVSSAEPSFALWGDSHAEAISPALHAAAVSRGQAGWLIARGGCLPFVGVNQQREGFLDCSEAVDLALRWIEEQQGLSQVWLAGRWALYHSGSRFLREGGHAVTIADGLAPDAGHAVFERGLRRTLDRLAAVPKIQVIWVGQVPESEFNVPHAMARAAHLAINRTFESSRLAYERRHSEVNQLLNRMPEAASVIKVDVADWFCTQDACIVEQDGVPIYRDTNHIRATTAANLGARVADLLP